MPWSEVLVHFQVLILALMKAIGGTCVPLALALYIILFLPFRQGARWALWATPLLGLVQSAGSFYAMSRIALKTSVSPTLWVPTAGVVLSVVAFALSVSGNNKRVGV